MILSKLAGQKLLVSETSPLRTLHQRLILATHIHVEYDNIYNVNLNLKSVPVG